MISKRRKVWIALGVMALLLAAIPMLWPVDEPKYNGRYLSEWLEEYAGYRLRPLSRESLAAQNAVRSIGTNALPCYLEWIAYEPPQWRKTLRDNTPRWMRGDALDSILTGNEVRRHNYALAGIFILGTNAISVVPVLESLMKDSSNQFLSHRATYALAYIGEPGFPILKSALADTNLVNRRLIPYAVGDYAALIGTNACLPILVEATQDRDFGVRSSATNVLMHIAPEVLTNAPSEPKTE